MSLTYELADFVVNSDYKDMPAKAITIAKECILDCLGCIFAGSIEPAGKIVTEYVRGLGGNPQSSVITCGLKTAPPQAAMANASMAHAIDYDDSALGQSWHPSVVLLPPILALGEVYHATGKDMIQAYIAGFEIAYRIGRAVHAHYYEGGWHKTGTVGSIGAAAAAAKISGLNTHQTALAFGIAASGAAGLRKNFGTMTKPLNAGNAAKNGVTAAKLAEMGFSADENIMDGPLGFIRTMNGSEEALAEMNKTLGTSYDLVSRGVMLKVYPSCTATHRCIDAMLFLKNEYGFHADDIFEVLLETDAGCAYSLRHHQPKTALQGKFSLEYCIAALMLDGRVGLQQFVDKKVLDPKVQQLVQRVKYVHPEGNELVQRQQELPHGVIVKLKDGRQFSHQVSAPRGSPENPMTQEERLAKFSECASYALSQEQIERCVALVSKLETLDDINKLTDAIASADSLGKRLKTN
ncbi:MmgE/PrpD family protein [Chloroflexota bacterium]